MFPPGAATGNLPAGVALLRAKGAKTGKKAAEKPPVAPAAPVDPRTGSPYGPPSP
jgi:hypothetical protein